MKDDTFTQEAAAIAESKLAELRNLDFTAAAALPGAQLEDIVVAGKEVQMTVFRQIGIPGSAEAVLVTVQLARAGLGGLLTYKYEKALVYSSNGDIREATESELLATGGG